MAITSGGAVGSSGFANSTNQTSWTVSGCTASVDQEVIVVIASDNNHTTYGYYSDVSSISDSAGNTWAILNDGSNDAAYTYSPTGNVNDGAHVSIFKSKITNALSSGTITITLNSAKVAKVCTISKYSVETGYTLRCVSSKNVGCVKTTNRPYDTSLGSLSISGLSSQEYLFLRGVAVEYYTEVDVTTATSGFTEGTAHAASGGSSSTSQGVGFEFKIATATSATSNPSFDRDADTASIFVALKESPLVADSTGGMMLGMSF